MKTYIDNCILRARGAIAAGCWCTDEKCDNCGWNPTVAAERKKDKLVLGQNGLYSMKKVEDDERCAEI